MELLTREVMRSRVDGSSMHASVNQVNQLCEHCSGQHALGMCAYVDVNNLPMEQAQVVGSFPRSNNPYSNTYNPGWRNHPNFSWRNDQQGQGMGQGMGQGAVQPPQQQAYQQRYGGGATAGYGVHHHHAAVPTYVDNVLMSSKRSSPGSSAPSTRPWRQR